MNKIYKVIWSKVKACYVVVSELAKRHSKGKSLKSAASLVALTAILAFLPVQVNATDVAPGDNIAQLKALNTKVDNLPSIHYFSVKSDDSANPDGTNWKNDGASGENAIAIGKDAKAKTKASVVVGLNASSGDAATDGVAVGNTASVTGFGGVAIGRKSSAQGQETVAIGTGAKGVLNGTIAIGGYANADGVGAVSIGRGSSSKRLGVSVGVKSFSEELGVSVGTQSFSNLRSVAVGEEAKAESKYSVAVGDQTASYAEAGVTLGNKTRVYGDSSVAIGNEARVSGKPLTEAEYNALPDAEKSSYKVQVARYPNPADPMNPTIEKTYFKVFNAADWNAETHYNSIAIGTTSFVEAKEAIGIGAATWIHGDRGVALGYTAVSGEKGTALGAGAQAKANAGVALGEGAVADTAAKVAGYDPQTGKASTETTPTWKSMKGAVSVGNADATRQITNLAAGSADTDAVNVAQLKALNQKVDDGAVHYYSVKSDQQGAGTNYANDGAKAADSMVIGISSSISEKAKNSTVLGNNNTLSNQPNARGVERDSENNSIVVGQNLTVEGARNAVFGTDYQNGTDKLLTHVAGERNTVIGVGNLVGYTAERVGTEWKYTKFKGHGDDENVVVGLTNTVNGGGVVVGTNTTVSAYGGVAFGHHNTVSGDEDKGVALGNDLNVSGYGALAVGTESAATEDYTIALGVESKAQALMAASMGYDSQAKASGSVALGAWSSAEAKQALALGYDSQAMVAGGVALGAKSVANRGKDVLGYDPVTGAAFANDASVAAALGKTAELTAAETNIANAQTAVTAAQQAYDADQSDANKQALRNAKNTLNTAKSKKNELLASYKSVFGAVSVGRNDGTRQITNLAAGTEDTDAVNVAQLKALSGKVDEGAVHYFSVAADDSAKPENTNWNNDGATGAKAIAIGRGAKADGKHSIALGSDGAEFSAPKTTGEAAIAIGSGAEAGVQDISIGLGAKATGGFGVAIGRQSEAKASTAVAMAYGAKAEGANSLAIGILSDAKTADSAAYGREAKALGAVSLAVGMRSKAGADHTAVFGAEATTDATAWNGTAIGRSAYIGKQAPDGTTPNIGVSNNYFTPVDDDTVVAPGKETMNSTAVGFGAKAFGYQDTALGAGAEAFDTNTVSIGVMSKAIGHYANALGKQARAEGKDSVAIGHWARSIGESSMALGDYAITSTLDGTTSVTKSAAIGSHARAASDNSVALGANSLANIADDVATKAYLSNEAFAKGNGVVSVGNEEYKVGDTTVAKNYRRITNVAGGAADNDAVNVAQLKALSQKTDNQRTHYYHVNDVNIPVSNYNNDGAKGGMALAAGAGAVANGTASAATGAFNQIQGNGATGYTRGFQGATSSIYGSFNTIAGKDGVVFDGVANSLVGVANRTENANGALIFGAGNKVTNSYREVSAGNTPFDVNAAKEALQKAITTGDNTDMIGVLGGMVKESGGSVLAIGGANTANYALLSKVVGVGNTLTGTSNTPSEYNMLDGFANTAENVQHVSVIGSNNKLSNTKNAILLGDNRKLTGANGSIVLGAADTEKELKVADAVLIGHNADVQKAGGVALGAGSVASVDKGVAGYDPTTKAASKKTDKVWKSTLAAVSVGNATDTRQITNLAAGTEDTDAVNVAQLKTVDKKVAVVFDDKKSLMSIDAKIKHEILEDPGRFPEGEGQSIALGKDAYAYMQGGRKAQGVLFGMKKATGAIAIGQNAKALSHSIAIGNRLYAGDMGDVKISPSDYNVENGSGVASTLLGNNSYAGGTLSTLVGSYSIMSTSYPGGHQKAYMQNAGAVSVGALNSIESATAKQGTSFFGKLPDDKSSGVANSIVGLANRAYNANGALIYGAGNEITNSIASVTAPAATGSVKAAAENLRKAIKTNPGGAVLAIGGGNKADLAVRSQLIGVANTLTGTSETPSEYNMLDGFNNTGTNVKHITLMGSENTVSDTTGAILLGDKRKLTGANGSIVLGAADTEKELTVKDAVLIGHNADVQKAGGVALGAQSVASVDKGVAGYDPAAGDHANDTTGTWKATAAAVSVGKAATPTGAAGSSAITRQITNVAAGTQDTDAVNVAQLKAVKTKMDTEVEAARTHYYSVEDKGFHVANYDNKGAKGGMALAAGAGTVANGTASTATGAFNQIQGDGVNGFSRGFQGATSSVYGSFNTIAGKNGVRFDGVANSIVGVANRTENANAALVFGAGNKVTNSYRKVSAFDQDKAKEALQKAITTGDNTDMIGVLGGMVKESGVRSLPSVVQIQQIMHCFPK